MENKLMKDPELLYKAGEKVVFLGNQAIARGAMEAGVGLAACYPGTPAAEIGISLADAAKKVGLYFEWSTNEKVAAEVAAGAAFSGVRSLTAMKHFGFNVACDSILPLAYTGVKAGMVIIVADDPQGHSSAQSEQDSRYFYRMGNFPVLEPSTAQECKDFTIKAFEISEKNNIPVVIRTTTMVGHATGIVRLGEIPQPKTAGAFTKDRSSYFNIGSRIVDLHKRVLEKMDVIEKKYASINRIEGKGKIGIIASGASYNYLREISPKNIKIAKLNMTYPISKKFVARFLKDLKKVVVIEELEPIIEEQIRAQTKIGVHGKDIFPRTGEFNVEIVMNGLAKAKILKGKSFAAHSASLKKINIPVRYPDFCAGCPHRFSFQAVKEALPEDTVYVGDIGCYSMGMFEPYMMEDLLISMGASQGLSHGIKKVSGQKVVAFIGDSTFFHAGMPGLANIIYNGSNPLVIILDNSITGMTGHQPNPGTGFNSSWEPADVIKIEDVVRALGVKNIAIVDPVDQEKLKSIVKEFSEKNEPSVIISRRMCVLYLKKAVAMGLLKVNK